VKLELIISPLIIFIPPPETAELLIKLELIISTFAKLVNIAPPASPALLLVKLQFIILRFVLRVYIPPPLIFAELS
jgi:hypothetical protein